VKHLSTSKASFLAVAATVLMASVVLAQGAGYALNWHSFTSGGASSGGGYSLQSSLGAAVAGVSSGGGLTLVAGVPGVDLAPVIITPPAPNGDPYESDDTCATAHPIEVGALAQTHVLGDAADVDWVYFTAQAGVLYRIDAVVQQGSTADVVMDLYIACDGAPESEDLGPYGAGGRIEWTATATGRLSVRVARSPDSGFGANARYDLTVSAIPTDPPTGAVILVAGRLQRNDPRQPRIDQVAADAYNAFTSYGYTNDTIYLLTSSDMLSVSPAITRAIDAPATTAALEAAITQWALPLIGPHQALSIYLVDHGNADRFYLDGYGEVVTAQQLDGWLDRVQAAKPGTPINVIVEACFSGSFINAPDTISGADRVIISSTDANSGAKLSLRGAVFSDLFLTHLLGGFDLQSSFLYAQAAMQAAHSTQVPWLDDTGDGVYTINDGALARQRGFTYQGTLADALPPQIKQVVAPGAIEGNRGVLQAQVIDDAGVGAVYAIVYPPSYQPPPPDETLALEDQPVIEFTPMGDDWYAATYTGFAEPGVYRIAIYATDIITGLTSLPTIIEVGNGSLLHLPLVVK
jgi:hypothetical protein